MFQSSQLPSYESDGIPSMVGIDEYISESEAEDRSGRNVQRLYDELRQFSSDHPDLGIHFDSLHRICNHSFYKALSKRI